MWRDMQKRGLRTYVHSVAPDKPVHQYSSNGATISHFLSNWVSLTYQQTVLALRLDCADLQADSERSTVRIYV